MNTTFERLQQKIRTKDIESALSEIQSLEATTKASPRLLVLKAMCLQLSQVEGPLEDVESALREALRLDDEYIDAHLELWRFLYAVQDQTRDGQAEFEKALTLLRKQNAEVIQGLLACAEEFTPEADAGKLRDGLERMLLSPPPP